MENIKAKKSLGQNFLINDHVVEKILNAIDYSKYENILEIGPGYGALTKSIVKKWNRFRSCWIFNKIKSKKFGNN